MELGAFSISLAVKDLETSKKFYEKLGFEIFHGDASQNWLIMKSVMLFLMMLFINNCPILGSSNFQPNALVELFGTFHAMGITVFLNDRVDPENDAIAVVEYRTGNEAYRVGLPLSRISPTQFVGSLFWLSPGNSYDVRITFSDPNEGSLNGVSLEATASTRPEITIPIANKAYIVSPDGSGVACSLVVPCSLNEGISQAQAGDEVVLREGVYYQGNIYLPRSGTPGNPIVIRSYANEKAVLDGADPNQFKWTTIGDRVFHTSIGVSDTRLVMADRVRLYPYPNLADLQNLNWGIPGFYADGTSLYVHLDDDADPNNIPMSISRYSNGFNVQQDYIYFEKLTFRHFGAVSSSRAISFHDASNNLVEGSTFAFNMMGVNLKGESHRNVIQNNTFYDAKYSWPWDAVKAASRLEQGGLDFSDETPGRGTVIRHNTFHDYFDAFTVCPQDPNDQTNETDVYENLVYNAGDDGVQTDGWCSNVRFWNNTFHDVLTGISLAPVVGGPVYALRNLMYRLGAGNNTYHGRSFKLNSNNENDFGPIYLFHNTVDGLQPDTYGLSISGVVPGAWSLIYSRNNIWSGSTYALRNKELSFPVDLDYDNLYKRNSDALVRWDNDVYDDFQVFISSSGQELNGFNVDPNFTSPECDDYSLNSASTLIDVGLIIPGVNNNYVGSAPEIGAFEYIAQDRQNGNVWPNKIFLPIVQKNFC